MNEEILLVKGQNFEINQHLVWIVENMDAPYVDYTLQLIDAKMKPVLMKLAEILKVTSSLATAQQGGDDEDKEVNKGEIPVNKDEILEVNLRNPYETGKMDKSDAAKFVHEKQSLKISWKMLEKWALVGKVMYLLDQVKEKLISFQKEM